MIAHPAVVQRLNAFIGLGWSDTHGGQLSLNAAGAGGQPVHGGPFYSRAGSYSRSVAGQMESNQVNYAWQLRDVPAGAGGFCECISSPLFSPDRVLQIIFFRSDSWLTYVALSATAAANDVY